MGNTVSEQLVDAFNSNDLDRVEGLAADDFELVDVASGETFRGKEGARRNAEGWFTAFPDAKIEIINNIVGGDWEVFEALARGTHTGPLGAGETEIPPTGRSMELQFVSIAQIRDGKIVKARDYYDIASIMQQLGLMPEAASATA
jgi:steroid delta-isomerase-like uncharacterized protein